MSALLQFYACISFVIALLLHLRSNKAFLCINYVIDLSSFSVFARRCGQKIVCIVFMGPLQACVENGVSGSYMDCVFKLVAHKESEI